MSGASVGSVPPGGRRSAGETRQQILAVATEMFSANGIRGTSADRIIEQVGITKVTFYRHFRTKSDLVVAYLEAQAELERGAIEHAISGKGGLGALLAIAQLIGDVGCLPGFRGCPFINAAAETPDSADPVRIVVDRHRGWTREMFTGLAARAGVPDPAATGAQLMMLRDGAMVSGYLEDADEVADELGRAYRAVIATE